MNLTSLAGGEYEDLTEADVRALLHVAESARALVREFFATPGPVPAEMGQLYLAVMALEDDR